jgi:hypothetical protein
VAMTQGQLREADAKNRAWRSFLQGLGIDVAVAVAIVAYQIASNPKPIVWAIVGASLARTVVQSAASYVMRRFLDGSKIPTPLPPDPPGKPAEVVDEPTTAKKVARRRNPTPKKKVS